MTATTSTPTANIIEEGPEQPTTVNIEMGPTTTVLIPELSTSTATFVNIMSAIAFQDRMRTLSRAETQLAQLTWQINAWVQQIVQASEDRCKTFITSFVDQHITAVDARVDAFEKIVQKRLAKAQPADLSTFYQELMKLKG